MLAGADGISYDWQWYRVWRYLGRWTDGISSPARCSTGWHDRAYRAFRACPCRRRRARRGVAAAFPAAVARGMAHVYVGCLRNTPLLLQLFFVYFLFAPAIGVGPFGAAVLALGLFEGAYMAELFRAGLQSVPRAQWEAGISLGLGVWNTLRLVILPQAVRRMLPPLTSQLVSLIKDTSLVSAIAVADLTMRAQVLIADTFLAFEIWLIVAALYLALTLCVALPARWMERRYAWR
ncbi:MAG: amino acid ABC transporter permease [Bilophila wadsworthia]